MTPTEFIAALEDQEQIQNADDVAEFLYCLDAKGWPAKSMNGYRLCPMEQGLKICGLSTSPKVGYTGVQKSTTSGIIHYWKNSAVKEFIRLFDLGWYPEMLNQRASRPYGWRLVKASRVYGGLVS